MNKYDKEAVEELMNRITILDNAKTQFIYNNFQRTKEFVFTQGFCLGGIFVALLWLLFIVIEQI